MYLLVEKCPACSPGFAQVPRETRILNAEAAHDENRMSRNLPTLSHTFATLATLNILILRQGLKITQLAAIGGSASHASLARRTHARRPYSVVCEKPRDLR